MATQPAHQKSGTPQGVHNLPPFLGVVCLECGKPFLIWKTEFEGIKPDDPDFDNYMLEGHEVKVIDREIIGDISNWCGCKSGDK